MPYVRAGLGDPPRKMFFYWGDFYDELQDWIQPLDSWRLILYDHPGVTIQNARAIEHVRFSGALFSPGSRGGHIGVKPPAQYVVATFELSGSDARPVALPTYFETSEETFEELKSAGERGIEGPEMGRAVVWRLLWKISKHVSVIRTEHRIYEVEDRIRKGIGGPLSIRALAEEADVSQRTLLGWFQAEHATTVQGYVRQTRAREACRLLLNTDLPIKAIATRVGIPDLHQFNKLVRGHVGLSPRQYRLAQSDRF
ncbi:MAG: helix-turn-helix transcriptional regulator [Armatimonadetes bacterium]|nr:helix-turn-helix transcriptional regulator [Armatimonadota bacterium]